MVFYNFLPINTYFFTINVTPTGLPHGQEKSGKTKKNDKSQEKWEVFEKIQEKVRNFFFKPQI